MYKAGFFGNFSEWELAHGARGFSYIAPAEHHPREAGSRGAALASAVEMLTLL